MTEPAPVLDAGAGPAERWARRGGVAAAALAAAVALLAAIWQFAGGALSLPACYAAAGLVAGVAAVAARRWPALAAAAGVVVAVAVADGATAGTGTPLPAGARGFVDPARVVWIPLPQGWVEHEPARTDSGTGVARRYRPQDADRAAAAVYEVQVHRTANDSYGRLEKTDGVRHLERVRRGPATGHRWRREADGLGEVGLELHHAGWRIHVVCRASLESRIPSQSFPRLAEEAERLIDAVLPLTPPFFARIDRDWFGL